VNSNTNVEKIEVAGARMLDNGNDHYWIADTLKVPVVTVTITTQDPNAKVIYEGEEVASFPKDVSRGGRHTIPFLVRAGDGSTRCDTLIVERYLDFGRYARVKWDNTMCVNLRLLTTENYRMATCRWYEDGKMVKEGLSFTKGNSITDVFIPNVEYYFELETEAEGRIRSTPHISKETFPGGFLVYPTLLHSGATLSVDANTEDREGEQAGSVSIYNITGVLVVQQPLAESHARLQLNLLPGVYIVKIKNWQTKIVVE
jgi:hypothetical protein